MKKKTKNDLEQEIIKLKEELKILSLTCSDLRKEADVYAQKAEELKEENIHLNSAIKMTEAEKKYLEKELAKEKGELEGIKRIIDFVGELRLMSEKKLAGIVDQKQSVIRKDGAFIIFLNKSVT